MAQVEDLQDGKTRVVGRRELYTEQDPVEREQPRYDGESVPVLRSGNKNVKTHPWIDPKIFFDPWTECEGQSH